MYLAHMDRRHGYGCVLHMDNSLISLLTDPMRNLVAWPVLQISCLHCRLCSARSGGQAWVNKSILIDQITQQCVVALMQQSSYNRILICSEHLCRGALHKLKRDFRQVNLVGRQALVKQTQVVPHNSNLALCDDQPCCKPS